MNVGIGTDAAQFHFWEYLFQILGLLSLQCIQVFGISCQSVGNPPFWNINLKNRCGFCINYVCGRYLHLF
jgi:hypothetical protein